MGADRKRSYASGSTTERAAGSKGPSVPKIVYPQPSNSARTAQRSTMGRGGARVLETQWWTSKLTKEDEIAMNIEDSEWRYLGSTMMMPALLVFRIGLQLTTTLGTQLSLFSAQLRLFSTAVIGGCFVMVYF